MDLFSYSNQKEDLGSSHSVENLNGFQSVNEAFIPLSEKLRPRHVDEVIGHERFIGPHSPLGKLLREGKVANLIVWGPPGSGKTSFALTVAELTQSAFITANAVDLGSKRLREIGDEGRSNLQKKNQRTILFVDEIHRLIRSQQDILLPVMEKGELVLIGATTENPGYEMSRAFMSRCLLIPFEKLTYSDLESILARTCEYLNVKSSQLLTFDAQEKLFQFCNGDARRLINFIDWVYKDFQINSEKFPMNMDSCLSLLLSFGQGIEIDENLKYDLISAFIKSVRGSDPDAAMYYLVRLLEGGEDPKYVARRLVILASEDVGNADPRALSVATDAFRAVEILGLPECKIPLAQATTYLAVAPKSNRSYLSLKAAQQLVQATRHLQVPAFLRSSAKWASSEMEIKGGYRYPHDFPNGFVEQTYFPEEIKDRKLYEPSNRGFEKQIQAYQEWLGKNQK